jgi:hypothetical protein
MRGERTPPRPLRRGDGGEIAHARPPDRGEHRQAAGAVAQAVAGGRRTANT